MITLPVEIVSGQGYAIVGRLRYDQRFPPAVVSGIGKVVPAFRILRSDFDPLKNTSILVTQAIRPLALLRPLTPAELGDQERNSNIDGGTVSAPGSGSYNIFATALQPPSGLGTISFLKVYAYVSTDDTAPAGTYVPCTTGQFIIKLSGGSRNAYGSLVSPMPISMGDFPARWESTELNVRPGGGPWTWADVANIVELGVTANYTVGASQHTDLRLDEVWLEVYGPIGSVRNPLTVSLPIVVSDVRLPLIH